MICYNSYGKFVNDTISTLIVMNKEEVLQCVINLIGSSLRKKETSGNITWEYFIVSLSFSKSKFTAIFGKHLFVKVAKAFFSEIKISFSLCISLVEFRPLLLKNDLIVLQNFHLSNLLHC